MNLIYRIWAKAGGLFSIIIFIYVLFISPYKFFSIQSAVWINLAILMLHQFEEYVYPGGFKDFFNNYIYHEKRLVKFKLNDKSAFHVNVTIGWTAYLICAIIGYNFPVFFMIILASTFINGIVHTGAALVFRMYNPGLITGLLIFIPFSLYMASNITGDVFISSGEWVIIAACALAGMLTIPSTLFIFREKEKIDI